MHNMMTGSIVALITPFHEDGSVNYEKVAELAEWHVQEGTDGILVLGTTAESPALTVTEKDALVETVIKTVNGRVPIMVGSGSNNTLVAKEQSLKYQNMGADALLVITPYYNKTTKAGMVYHFTEVADAVDIPVIIYNVPGRTGCCITYDAVAELAQHKNIMGIKEASGDIGLVSKIGRLTGEDFYLYSGNDDMVVPLMSVGGAGVISVWANILPKVTHDMVQAWMDGDHKKARDIQLHYLDFVNALFIETNPIPIKEAMNLMGMNVGGYRLPLCPMEDHTKAVLVRTMQEIGLL
ncbi:MAG: 4-hydroxy-tetrahydrodipicolinate synthase [Firmicutes bacterium]|nr:4-hydroxy-tetrahydrodipicolinate synthase [Bacillota bacterium]